MSSTADISSASFSTAYRVEYTVTAPWSEGRVHRYFETLEAAEEFREPLGMAARSAGRFHALPVTTEVDVLTANGGARFVLGPPIEFDRQTAVNR